jgi:hypothetical protein
MSKIRIQLLAATAAIATATLIGGTVAGASAAAVPHVWGQVTARPDTTIEGEGLGTGATAAKAKQAAQDDLVANFNGCHLPPNLVYDTDSNGVWSAEVTSTCLHEN